MEIRYLSHLPFLQCVLKIMAIHNRPKIQYCIEFLSAVRMWESIRQHVSRGKTVSV